MEVSRPTYLVTSSWTIESSVGHKKGDRKRVPSRINTKRESTSISKPLSDIRITDPSYSFFYFVLYFREIGSSGLT